MKAFGFFASFLLVVSFILLILATVSAPLVNNINLAKIVVNNGNQVWRFGVFGYCQTAGVDKCSPHKLGYNVSDVVGQWDPSGVEGINHAVNSSVNGLTYALVLHPVAAALALVAAIIACFSFRWGYIVASIFVVLAFICAGVATAIDFALFAIVKRHIKSNLVNATFSYGAASWMTLVAFILLFLAFFFTFFACCTLGRKQRREREAAQRDAAYAAEHNGEHMPEKKKFWQRSKA